MLAAEQAANNGEDTDEEELIQATPGGWWLGDEQISGKIGYGLLRDCLISEVSSSSNDTYHVYHLNGDGRRIAKHPNVEPPIRRLMS